MKKILIVMALLVVVGVIAIALMDDPAQLPVATDNAMRVADSSSTRTAPAGTFVGYADKSDTHAWLGLPYASPPVGERRWRAPVAAAAQEGVTQALRFQPPCVQFWSPLSGVAGEEGQVAGSEDCLYLNVWAPGFDQASTPVGDQRLPVMVWIHGGGNTIGAASSYPGHQLAGSQKVVYISVSYRLGILGWLGHEAFRATSETAEDASGNYAVLDLIAALQWVQDNISAFGGNPDNVTVFGESAGGRDVYALLGSPLAKGLFHRAIVQSGSAFTMPLARAENYTDDPVAGEPLSSRELINALLIDSGSATSREEAATILRSMSAAEIVDFMREKTPEELFAVIEPSGFGMYRTPQNLRDGYVLPGESLLQRFTDKSQYNSVPIMLGTNRDEAKVFMSQNPEYVAQWLGFIPRIRDLDAYNRAAAYFSAQWKALSVDEPATVLSETQDNVYAYRFDWDESPSNWLVDFPNLLGAGHGLEISYVFGDFEGGISIPFLLNEDNEPGRLALSRSMMSYWSEFAYSGDPGAGRNGEEVPWTAWDNDGDKTILLDTQAGGGIRMSDEVVSAASIKRRLLDDELLTQQRERCRWYANLFLNNVQLTDFWQRDEYESFGQGGCKQYDPRAFAPLR